MINARMVLLVCSWLLIIAVTLPLIRHDYWVFRILEYPRLQKFAICLSAFVLFLFLLDYKNAFELSTMVLLGLCVGYLTKKIWPYTIFSAKQVTGVSSGSKGNQLRLFTANVYQENTQYEKMLEQIRQVDPDIIFLLETDKKWENQMKVLESTHPYTLKEPLPNTYGLLFYSRFKIVDGGIKYLVTNDVPSIEVTLQLPSGQLVKAFGLHPKPPVPGEDNHSTAKDKEIMKIAFKVKKVHLPVIVMGDLNDVAWSYVTELFTKTSSLLDPRRGRGFYSTFSANHWYLRFPLDYIFCSSHFGLVSMKKLPHNGSDHFAIFTQLEFRESLQNQQEAPEATEEEIEEAADKATQPVTEDN